MTTNEIFCEDDMDRLKRSGLHGIEITLAEKFSSKFCPAARIYLVSIFARARLAGKDFWRTLNVCEDLYKEVWSQGTPCRIGDPDEATTFEDDGYGPNKPKPTHGWHNVCAFFQAYKNLGFPLPKSLT